MDELVIGLSVEAIIAESRPTTSYLIVRFDLSTHSFYAYVTPKVDSVGHEKLRAISSTKRTFT